MIENALFKALADPTRRRIFEKLADGGRHASALREGIAISQSRDVPAPGSAARCRAGA
ncbi:ArsR/SmtB family transcription factor [Azotobacter sp. CWF10]